MKILIADDDFVSRNLLHSILLPHGTCDMATNGKEALTAFEEALEHGVPYDLICLDIEMPEMCGRDTMKWIRELEESMAVPMEKRVKIILITVARDLENVKAAKEFQCTDYILKPIEKKRLLDKIAGLKDL